MTNIADTAAVELKVFALMDNKVDSYGLPFYLRSVDDAHSLIVNTFQTDPDKRLNPVDFELFELGTFNIHTGKFETHEPKHLTNVKHLMPKEETEPKEKEAK